jgi:uncharacterized membrane protein
MQPLRFLMFLCLVVWVGGIIFFSFVVAPTAFSGILPSRELAGRFVGHSLGALHWIGLVAGLVFIATSLAYSRMASGFARPMSARNVFVALMLLLTAISLFSVTPRMDALKTSMGVIDNVSITDARRIEFNRLHGRSVELEVGVLLMGLAVIYLTAKPLS